MIPNIYILQAHCLEICDFLVCFHSFIILLKGDACHWLLQQTQFCNTSFLFCIWFRENTKELKKKITTFHLRKTLFFVCKKASPPSRRQIFLSCKNKPESLRNPFSSSAAATKAFRKSRNSESTRRNKLEGKAL